MTAKGIYLSWFLMTIQENVILLSSVYIHGPFFHSICTNDHQDREGKVINLVNQGPAMLNLIKERTKIFLICCCGLVTKQGLLRNEQNTYLCLHIILLSLCPLVSMLSSKEASLGSIFITVYNESCGGNNKKSSVQS